MQFKLSAKRCVRVNHTKRQCKQPTILESSSSGSFKTFAECVVRVRKNGLPCRNYSITINSNLALPHGILQKVSLCCWMTQLHHVYTPFRRRKFSFSIVNIALFVVLTTISNNKCNNGFACPCANVQWPQLRWTIAITHTICCSLRWADTLSLLTQWALFLRGWMIDIFF